MSKRRPDGDGLIRKRNDGRWEGRIVVGHKSDRKPIYRSVFAKTQKELMPKLNTLKAATEGKDFVRFLSVAAIHSVTLRSPLSL